MFENLEEVKKHYEEIMHNLTIPEVVSDITQYKKLILEQSNLEPIYKAYTAFRKAEESEKDALFILDNEKDKDLIEMAKEELSMAKEEQERLTKEIQLLLLPKDENDDKNIVMEIRGGAGGEEAALFAGSLYRMYTSYAEKRGWKTELVSFNETGLGGLKEVVFIVNGQGAYSRLKYESGVPRVQRVPETESGGRIHTSTATVAVMPEVEDVEVGSILPMSRWRFSVLPVPADSTSIKPHPQCALSMFRPEWLQSVRKSVLRYKTEKRRCVFFVQDFMRLNLKSSRRKMRKKSARSLEPETVRRRFVPITSRREE